MGYYRSIKLQFIVLSLLSLIRWASCAIIDLTQSNMYSNSSILHTICNKDMELDFSFSQNTVLTCQNQSCSLKNGQLSTLYVLDANNQYLRLNLYNAQITKQDLVKGYNLSSYWFVFYFHDDFNHEVDILIPLTFTNGCGLKHVLSVSQLTDTTFNINILNDFMKIVNPSDGISLQAFNFLNYRDYSRFSTVADHSKMKSVFINQWIFNFPNAFPDSAMTVVSKLEFIPYYQGSGNKVCYSSYTSASGMFQTRLRENWPLWTCFFQIAFFWACWVISSQNTHQVFDTRFKNNNMTCWGFYSIHYLSNQIFFSKLSRISLLFFIHSFQAVVLAALYTAIGVKIPLYSDYSIIAWFSVISSVVSVPIPLLLGATFLQQIYKVTYEKLTFKKQLKIKQKLSEQKQAKMYVRIYKLQYKLDVLYYWYYLIIFIGFICFWAGSLHMTLSMHIQFYYLQRLWLVSLGVSFVVQNLILQPILAKILGGFQFYRRRGFFYRFQIGQLYHEVQFQI